MSSFKNKKIDFFSQEREEMDSCSSVITPEDVLESLMNDGTIDALRLKIINQLKANVNWKKKKKSLFLHISSLGILYFLFFQVFRVI